MIIPEEYGQVNFRHAGIGLPNGAECTLGFNNEGGPLQADEAAEAWATIWAANIVPQMSSSVTFTGTYVKLGPNQFGPFAEFPAAVQGSEGSTCDVPSVAALIIKNTALGGRQGRGRMFLPGLEENEINTGGEISSTRRTLLDAGFVDLMADATTALMLPVVLHNDALAPTPITSMVTAGLAATQRRRLRP